VNEIPLAVGSSVTLLPGLPGSAADADFGELLPETAREFTAALESVGLRVTIARPEATSVAVRGELILPIIEFASGVAVGAVGQLVADGIIALVKKLKRPPAKVRIRVIVKRGDEPVTIDIEGNLSHVVETLRELE